MNIVEKIDMADCTGCHSCYNFCPVYAIRMESNSEGFLIPNINEKIHVDIRKLENES